MFQSKTMAQSHNHGNDLPEPGTPPEVPGLKDVPEPDLPAPRSFILKVWLVQDSTDPRPGWHGRITHVPSGSYMHVRSFAQIVWFIADYLEAMGVRLPLFWRLYRWLSRFRQIRIGL